MCASDRVGLPLPNGRVSGDSASSKTLCSLPLSFGNGCDSPMGPWRHNFGLVLNKHRWSGPHTSCSLNGNATCVAHCNQRTHVTQQTVMHQQTEQLSHQDTKEQLPRLRRNPTQLILSSDPNGFKDEGQKEELGKSEESNQTRTRWQRGRAWKNTRAPWTAVEAAHGTSHNRPKLEHMRRSGLSCRRERRTAGPIKTKGAEVKGMCDVIPMTRLATLSILAAKGSLMPVLAVQRARSATSHGADSEDLNVGDEWQMLGLINPEVWRIWHQCFTTR